MKNFSKKELVWIERLQKVLDAQPESISCFCTGTNISVFKGKELPIKNEGVDSSIEHKSINNKNWEAGAY